MHIFRCDIREHILGLYIRTGGAYMYAYELFLCICISIYKLYNKQGGARGIMVIVVGNGHGDTSSNPGRD